MAVNRNMQSSWNEEIHGSAIFNSDPNAIEQADDVVSTVKGKTRQSKRLPFWLWFIIAKSLGIKLHPNDKPVVSSLLHLLTIASAVGMVFTNTWYEGFNIASKHTKEDILDGTVSILMVSAFCLVGVYAHRLAFRLFMHPKFLGMMRLHSKTIMKINSGVVILLVSIVFIVALNLNNVEYIASRNGSPTEGYQTGGILIDKNSTVNPCQTVEIPLEICQTYYFCQMIFSIFFVLWNMLVALILASVARTHTISIRRFICELDQDAHLHDKQFRKSYYHVGSDDAQDHLQHYVWEDTDRVAHLLNGVKLDQSFNSDAPPQPATPSNAPPTNAPPPVTVTSADSIEEDTDEPPSVFSAENLHLEIKEDEQSNDSPSRNVSVGRFRRLSGDNEDCESITPHIMSNQEIMHKYWKIATRVKLTSAALQRWMCCITAMILIYTVISMVYWLSHEPTLYGIVTFILPLFLLPLLASSYAEVNYEGVKLIQSIMPTEGRYQVFKYCLGQPIQMTVYGHMISYGTMGTVLAAIIAALASKILLEELRDF